MAERERKLDALNTFGLTMRKQRGPTLMQRLKGEDDYGTSLGGGATAAKKTASQKAWDEGKSLREMEPDVRNAMREAAAEERREAKEPRKYAKGGSVKGSGCERQGLRKCKVV
jgi:hypothetical protein